MLGFLRAGALAKSFGLWAWGFRMFGALGLFAAGFGKLLHSTASIWEFPHIGDPNIVP